MKKGAGRNPPPEVSEEPLQITVPGITKRSLKIRAAETGVTMRAFVLSALAAKGIEVPEIELHGARRKDR
jgi:hypothetical protein